MYSLFDGEAAAADAGLDGSFDTDERIDEEATENDEVDGVCTAMALS